MSRASFTTDSSSSGNSTEPNADACTEQTRRTVLLGALATTACLGCSAHARADEDPPGSDERPQKGDVLVFSEGDKEGKLVTAADLPAGGPPVHAWPKDPKTSVVRSASRLNEILMGVRNPVMLIRIKPGDMNRVVKRQGQESFNFGDLFAFTKVCSHLGCPSSLYEQQTYRILCPCHQSQFDALHFAKPIFGPAARALAQLPITIDQDGYLVAAGDFIEPVGPAFWERKTI